MYLPSRFQDEGRLQHLLYFQDVSGSIGNKEILRFNSELKFVWDTFQPKRMTIAQFNTRITRIDEFEEGDIYEKIKIVGRGGTCLEPVAELIQELKPTAVIIFTDMYVSFQPIEQMELKIPVLWVGVNAPDIRPNYGKTIHIKEK